MPNYKIGIDIDADSNAPGVVKEAVTAFDGLGKALPAVLGVAGIAGVGTALAGVGIQVFNVASDIKSATNQIGASLGVSGKDAKAYGAVIKQVYGNNFGDSIADVGTAVEQVAKQLKLAANDPALKTMTEDAFRLRDVFEVEVNESVAAADALIKQFGITGDEAMDFIAKGFQKGLNSSGDFLDTIGEYSNQFGDLGFSAQDFFGILETGQQAGVLGTDKIGDAIKEMNLRLTAGGETMKTVFQTMGMDFEQIEGFIRGGDEKWSDYFDNIIRGIESIEDPIERAKAQVAIFGTAGEDLGTEFTAGLSTAKTSMAEMEGAADSLNTKYDTLGSFFEGLWRQVQVGLEPFGAALLTLANDNMPALQGAFNTLQGNFYTGIGWLRLAWDANLGGMRDSAMNFMTLDQDFALFWARLNLLFGEGEQEQAEGWAAWLSGIADFGTSWWRLTLTNWGLSFEALHYLQNAWTALMGGDWEGFWDNLAAYANTAMDIPLNYIEFVFGHGLRNQMVTAMHGMWDAMKEIWNNIDLWWSERLGKLLDFFGMLPDDSPFGFNSAVAVGASRAEIMLPQSQNFGGWGGGDETHVNVYVERGDPEVVREATEIGVRRAQRARGE